MDPVWHVIPAKWPVLSMMVFAPVIGAIALLFIPKQKGEMIKTIAATTAAIPLLLGLYLLINFKRGVAQMQFVEHQAWIPAFNVEYLLGVDGLSITMVLLTSLLGFICMLASWGINDKVKGYFSLFLLLEAGMMGTFVALDLVLFYIFWEVMLLPMYFLIGVWGAKPRKDADGMIRGGPYSAIKFFIYTLVGSVLMLVAILAVYYSSGPAKAVSGETVQHTFNVLHLMKQGATGQFDKVGALLGIKTVIWFFFFIAFAIKIPMFPFHTWLPDAHVDAPTAISVILAGVLLKMGTYGILRFNYGLMPETSRGLAWFITLFAVINIVYGALCAMGQIVFKDKDLKRLVAYSSISHMGYVMLGMAAFNPIAINGAVLQMFNHGTITAMMFLSVGVIYDRAHHRRIDGFGGLAKVMPVYAAITALAWFAALGLPGLSGFVSEVMVLLGAFAVPGFWPKFAVFISTTAVVLTAGYMLWSYKYIFLGEVKEGSKGWPEINTRELVTLIPIGLIVIFLGVYPKPIISLINGSLTWLIQHGAKATKVASTVGAVLGN